MEEVNRLSHLNDEGRPKMVDVTDKEITHRLARARGLIRTAPETLQLIKKKGVEKGDVLSTAQIAGIIGAKQTSNLIPMCHPLNLTGIDLKFDFDDSRGTIEIEAEVKVSGQTGVEMEALTAVSVAALTIYDMCKSIDKSMIIEKIGLVEKKGGKSGHYINSKMSSTD